MNIAIKKVELLSLIVYLTIFIPLIFLLSKKYIILINKYKKISLVQSTKINIISSFYNIFLPAKIGDIFRIFYSKIPKKDYANCFLLTLFEKILSLFFLVIIVILFSNFTNLFILILFLIGIFLIILILINNIKKINFILNFFLKNKIKLNKKIFDEFKKNLFIFSLIDVIIWFLIFFQIFIISESLSIDLGFNKICFIFGYSIILGLIPISFGGFGIRDIIIYKSLESIAYNQEILVLLLFFNLRYFIPAFFGFFIKIRYLNVK